jgi:hypothetical protein
VTWNLRDIRVLWLFNARPDGNLDVVVTNETAKSPLLNGSNSVCLSSICVQYGYAKYSEIRTLHMNLFGTIKDIKYFTVYPTEPVDLRPRFPTHGHTFVSLVSS